MSKKKQTVILLGLVLSVCINIVLFSVVFHKGAENSMIGTYCTGEGLLESDVYLVFEKDDSYVLYRQFELLEKGKYRTVDIDDANIFSLESEDVISKHYIVYNKSDGLCHLIDDNRTTTFTKVSSTPTYINLQNKEL